MNLVKISASHAFQLLASHGGLTVGYKRLVRIAGTQAAWVYRYSASQFWIQYVKCSEAGGIGLGISCGSVKAIEGFVG